MNTDMETWRPITGMEEYFEVSDMGRIRRTLSGKIMSDYDNGSGYRYISLTRDGKKFNKYVHRIVAFEFIDNPNNGDQVNHKDGIKTNNAASNLEWVSIYENMQHASRLGLLKMGESSHLSKLTEKEVEYIRELHLIGVPRPVLSRVFKISVAQVHRIIHNQLWKHTV